MGTENVGSVLEALVKMTRPTQLLEIGAGYTTLCMLSALSDVAAELHRDAQIVQGQIDDPERQSLLIPRVALTPYHPSLTVFEDFSVQPSAADRVVDIAQAKGWDAYLNFVSENFFDDGPRILADLTAAVDVAWLDAGDPIEDIRFVNTLLPYMASDSWILMHEPTLTIPVQLADGTTAVRPVTVPVVRQLIRSTYDQDDGSRIEFVVMPEVHKVRQGGLLVIHKLSGPEVLQPVFDSMDSEVKALQRLLRTQDTGDDLSTLKF
ncbi:hypothetical protein ASG84_25735 [Rhodococcus sp. Leaf278]|nr:hypothetical protein ASG84_25735 [Rhodococcus sp. Leaf278]